MRNFYFEADISGRNSTVTGGPRDIREGTIDMTLYQREKGQSVTAIRVQCYREGTQLITRVSDRTGKVVFRYETSF